jgi:general secretion pathway protein F
VDFSYRALDARGEVVSGVMDAADERAVVARLQHDACLPIEVRPRAGGAAWRRALVRPGARRIRSDHVVALTQQLASLLEAGLPLDRALRVLQEVAPTPRLAAVAADLLQAVQGGAALSEALARHEPRPFSRLYVSLVRAGERAGALDTTLGRLARLLEEAKDFRDAVVSALVYPALLAASGAVTVLFLMGFVLPRFGDIFKDMGHAIPLPAQVLLSASAWVQQYWWALGLGALAAVLLGRVALGTPAGRRGADRVALRIPVVGGVLLTADVARFARVLGTLLHSGVPIVAALGAVGETLASSVLVEAVRRLADDVKRGAGLAGPIAQLGLFPPLAVQAVRIGEETGRLDELLLKIADTYEADVRRRVERVLALLEPAIILVMGLVVGAIVVAMLLAIVSLTEIPL